MIKYFSLYIFLFMLCSFTTNSEANSIKKIPISFIEKESNAQEFSHMKKIYDPMIEKNDKRFIKKKNI